MMRVFTVKRIYVTFTVLFFFIHSFSAPISKDSAEIVAQNFFKHKSRLKSTLAIERSFSKKKNNVNLYYVYNFVGGGWIVVAAHNFTTPVLAYSKTGSLDEEFKNPSVERWFNDLGNQIFLGVKKGKQNKSSAIEWQDAFGNKFKTVNATVAPLLTTKWNQNQYYNDLCPEDPFSPMTYGGHVPAGCVAIAMAQIMKYYEFPAKGNSEYSYYHPKYGYQSANFGATEYHWEKMEDRLTSPNFDVAQLVYHCGVAVEMNYDALGSGAFNPRESMIKYFSYSDSMKYYSRNTDQNGGEIWRAILKLELDSKRLVYYTGYNNNSGHAFVCDGYDNSFPTKYHFNWGWGGYADGYFAIENLDPDNDPESAYNYYNVIMTNIKPGYFTAYKEPIISRISSPYPDQEFQPDTSISVSFYVETGKPDKTYLWIDGTLYDSTTVYPAEFKKISSNLSFGKHALRIRSLNKDTSYTDSLTFYIYNKVNANCWKLKYVYSTTEYLSLKHFSVVDSNVVWATIEGDQRKFMVTYDGGENWKDLQISDFEFFNMNLSNICGISASKAYACLNPGEFNGGAILMTTDSGKTWTRQPSADFTNSWADWVHFFDENNGVCMGDSYQSYFVIYSTNNGGVTWERANTPQAYEGEAAFEREYDAYDNSIWFGTSYGRVFKSFDKGHSWTVSENIFSSANNYYIRFKDEMNAIAHLDGQPNNSNEYYTTNDGGNTWVKHIGQNDMSNLYFIHGTNSTWINCNGYTYISDDDCSTFNSVDKNAFINIVSFKSPTIGWGSGSYSSTLGGIGIYKWDGSFLPIQKNKVTFKVVDQYNNGVPEVQVFGEYIDTTDNSGNVYFNTNLYGNSYRFSFYKNGYAYVSEKYFIQKDTLIKITLKRLGGSLENIWYATFKVKDLGNKPVSGIQIFFNDSSKVTDFNGEVFFTNLKFGESYVYSLINDSAYIDYGSLEITEPNNIVNITYLSNKIYRSKKIVDQIFPNPASDVFCIASDSIINTVKIFNYSGQLIKSINAGSNTILVPTDNFVNGIYFVQIIGKNKSKALKVIINKRE